MEKEKVQTDNKRKGSLLLSELDKEHKKATETKLPDAVTSVQKLLAYDQVEDRQMLRKMGIDKHLQAAEAVQGRKIDLEANNKAFHGDVFHIDTIKKLALNYRLRFLKTCYYVGGVDVLIPGKIKEFGAITGVDVKNEAILSDRFFILAPSTQFSTERIEIPKEPSALKKFFVALARDPILFYKIDESHFRMIYKWGKDFSILRAIQGWRWKSRNNFLAYGFLVTAPFAAMALLLAGVFGAPVIAQLITFAAVLGMGTIANWSSNVKNRKFIQENLTRNNWDSNRSYY